MTIQPGTSDYGDVLEGGDRTVQIRLRSSCSTPKGIKPVATGQTCDQIYYKFQLLFGSQVRQVFTIGNRSASAYRRGIALI